MIREQLKQLLLRQYADMKRRLATQLGSQDMAEDALQETWLKVHQMRDAAVVDNPQAYLFRMAMNAAADQRQMRQRLLTGEEVHSLLDDLCDPVETQAQASDRRELERLQQVIESLPRRQRRILLDSRIHEIPHRELARQHGVSTRTIEKELRSALLFCGRAMDREVIQRFGPGAGQPSQEKSEESR